MTPATFPQQNVVYAKDQPEYQPLPAHRSDDGVITCCWQLTWRERLSVLLGGRIWHQVMAFGKPLQPQLLSTKNPLKGA